MAGLWARVKTWIEGETVKGSDLNAEFDNIRTNSVPSQFDDYSANSTQMRIQTTPGAQGSESLPTSLAGEIERLRFVLSRIVGGTYWYDNPNTSLTTLNSIVTASLLNPKTRIESGRVDANNQPMFLIPNGSGSVRLAAASTSLRGYINNTAFTVSSNVDLSGLTSGSTFTTLVNDAALAGADSTKTQGENDTTITVDTPTGSAPTTGSYQAWKIVSGVNTEYFFGRYASATAITKCLRGHLFDSSDAAIPRIAISNNDTITLQRCAYIFYTTAGVLESTYNFPYVQKDTPSSGVSSGDYWFDLDNGIWKKYSGGAFVDASAVFLGVAFIGSSNTIVGCRSVDFSKPFATLNTIELEKEDSNTIRATKPSVRVNVYGENFDWYRNLPSWVMSTDLDSGLTEQSSKAYYLYVTDAGDTVISDVAPYDRRHDLLGFYHPHKPWRCVGTVTNDGSSNFGTPSYADYNSTLMNSSIATNRIADQAITQAKLAARATGTSVAAGGVALSASSGTFNTASGSSTAVTGVSATITTTGRPVKLGLTPDGTSNISYLSVEDSSAGINLEAELRIMRDGALVALFDFGSLAPSAGTIAATIPVSSVAAMDFPAAGTYVYTLEARLVGGDVVRVIRAKLYAYET